MNDIRKFMQLIETTKKDIPSTDLINNESVETLVDIIVEMGPDRLATVTEELENLAEFRDDKKATEKWQSAIKMATRIFGGTTAAKVKGAYRAFKNAKAFNKAWSSFSTEYNLKPTTENIKKFLKTQYDLDDSVWAAASKQVPPQVDKDGKVTNMDDMIPALAYHYHHGIEQKIDDKMDDIDSETKTDTTEPSNVPGPTTDDDISFKMSDIIKKTGLTTKQVRAAIAGSRSGLEDAMKHKDVLAVLGYAYLKAKSS